MSEAVSQYNSTSSTISSPHSSPTLVPIHHQASVHLPASSSGILVAPHDPLTQPQRPRAKKRVSIDVHIPLEDQEWRKPRRTRMSVSLSSEHVLRPPSHTKDVQGRFKNRRRRSKSVPRRTCAADPFDILESEEDVEHQIQSEEPRGIQTAFSLRRLNTEDRVSLKRKRKASKESRSSVSSLSSGGFSILRGHSSKMVSQQNMARRNSSRTVYIPAELLPPEILKKSGNAPVDLLDYSHKYGDPQKLIIPALFCILTGMAALALAAMMTGKQSKRVAVFGCGILSTGGILMVMSLCWYYVKSKCLYGDEDLERIRKMSKQMLPPVKNMFPSFGSNLGSKQGQDTEERH